jgi:LAO/AO transport system kinase
MQEHCLDADVFVRSLGTRGAPGGLSNSVPMAIQVLGSAGFQHVIVETVGIGQAELAIRSFASTVVVVLTPGWGDSIQANKAGVLEIADIFVVNKSDQPGADQTIAELRSAQTLLGGREGTWEAAPIIATVASDGTGVGRLADAIEDHEAVAVQRGDGATYIQDILRSKFQQTLEMITISLEFESLAEAVDRRDLDPWSAAAKLL